MATETTEEIQLRWQKLKTLQKAYPTFTPFLQDCMILLNFQTSFIQEDIGKFMSETTDDIMVQAQRSQAKSTIAVIFAIWSLIHNPKLRIIIVSSTEKIAMQMSTLCRKFIYEMDILECMRPGLRDRTNISGFDIHGSLKGIDKSPSISCLGITGSNAGYRSDLIIVDDIESNKNAITHAMRESLVAAMNAITHLNSKEGRVIYLGTPQSIDSIYNNIVSKGFNLRIWPGRYPTNAQLKFYGEHLAPIIREAIERDPSLQLGGGLLGDEGQAVDVIINNEETLLKKEIATSKSEFQLHYMLNTYLSDQDKYVLKTEKLIGLVLGGDKYPLSVTRDHLGQTTSYILDGLSFKYKIGNASDVSLETSELQSIVMYIDPAGGGTTSKDETGYAVAGFLNGYIYILDVGGVEGGYEDIKMIKLAHIAKKWKVNKVVVEENFGKGAFKLILLPFLRKHYAQVAVEDDMVGQVQKEKRIISILEGPLERGLLIINNDIALKESNSIRQYGNKGKIYSFFFQLSKLTNDKQSLAHDDRIDALSGVVNYFLKDIAIDQLEAIKKIEQKALDEFMNDPFGTKRQAEYQEKMRQRDAGRYRRPSLLKKYLN